MIDIASASRTDNHNMDYDHLWEANVLTDESLKCAALKPVLALALGLTVLVATIVAGPAGAQAQDILTPNLRSWLDERGDSIVLGVTQIPPQIILDSSNGSLSGLCVDFIGLIEERLGCRFRLEYCDTWDDVMRKAWDREIDIVWAAQMRPEREDYLLFSEPYWRLSNKIIVRNDRLGEIALGEMTGMSVAVSRGSAILLHLRDYHPDLTLVPVEDELVALTRVSFGEVDAAVVEIARASYYMERASITNLRVAGDAEYDFDLRFASRKDWPELREILDRGLAAVADSDRRAVFAKWISLRQTGVVGDRTVLTGLGIAALIGAAILLTIVLWNRSLRRQVGQRTADLERELAERRRVERALRSSEERNRTLVENLPQRLFVKDRDGVYVSCNVHFADDIGVPLKEIPGQTDFDIFPEELAERYRAADGVVIESGETLEFEEPLHKDGREWVVHTVKTPLRDDSGATIGVLGMFWDVTAKKRAEEEIRKFKTIVEVASYGVVIADMDETMLYVNRAAAEMHGYDVAESVGQKVDIFHSAAQRRAVDGLIQKGLADGSFGPEEVWHARKDGTTFPTIMSGSVMTDDTGNPLYMTATAIDATEIKRLQDFAERAQRLETAGRIAGQVAHDFNNLLGPLVAYPDLIKSEMTDMNSRVGRMLDDMERAAVQMAEINQQLLTLGRRGHYNLEPISMNEVVRQAIDRMPPPPKTLSLHLELATDLMAISGGVSQLMRVIINLADNACDAMGGVGQLTVRTENYYLDKPRGSVDTMPPGEYVRVVVEDTGCGVSSDVISRMFDPFFSTKKADRRRGSGLGLSVVHSVIEDHGGMIDCKSDLGSGTSFYLYFPITREEITAVKAGSVAAGEGEKILVVDDDGSQLEVARALLTKLGYSVAVVASGEDALDSIGALDPDLVLLDMVMPGGMDGAETYARMLDVRPSQKAIVYSGYAETDAVRRAVSLGAGGFVKKPLTLKTVAAAVRAELDRVVA